MKQASRTALIATVVLALGALSVPASAKPDVCVENQDGQVRVAMGDSVCEATLSGIAIAVNGSVATADGSGMHAIAINGSEAWANGEADNRALAVNNSWANAWDVDERPGGATSTAINDSFSDSSDGSSAFAVNNSEAYADSGGAACAHNGETADDTGGTGEACP